jgi:PAS domain S-box-containing protein
MNADETHNNTSMFGRLKIGTKILIVTALISITIIGAIGIISDLSTHDAFKTEAFNKLTAVREMKGQQIEEYFGNIAQQIRSLSQSKDAIEGMKIFKTSIRNLSPWIHMDEGRKRRLHNFHLNTFSQEYRKISGSAVADIKFQELINIDDIAQYLQSTYIAENEHPIGQKNELVRATDINYYNSQHNNFHPFFNHYLEKFGFYDIFLIDNEDGRIIYSVFKEIDFGTSLVTGPYQDSNLARAFNAARVSTDPDFVAVVDFEPYTPSYSAPAAFMASPIIDNGIIIGVMAFQMPVDQINDIMTSRRAWKDVGLGLSGETYLVGADKLLRNQSRFLIEDRENYLEAIRDLGTPEETVQKIHNLNSTIGLQLVDTEGTRAALAGESSTRIFPDYREVSVLSSFRPLDLQGLNWVIMSEIDEAEAFQPFDKLRDRMIMLASILMALTIYVSYFFSLNLTRPLRFLEASAHALSEGRLDESIKPSSNDEIGDLALSFETMRVALKKTFAEVEQQKNELEDRVLERTTELEEKEAQLRLAFDNMPAGIKFIDKDLKIIAFNQQYLEVLGYPDDLIRVGGSSLDELKYQAKRGDMGSGNPDELVEKVLEIHGENETVSIEREVADGRFAAISIQNTPDGQRVTVVNDITERKKAEQAMHEVYQIFDQMPMNVFVRDAEGRFRYINHAYEVFHKVKNEDIVGKTLSEVFPKTGAPFDERDDEVIKEGKQISTEEIIDTGGGTVTLSVIKFPISDLEGNRVAVAGIDLDITKRKQVEKQVADQLAFTESLLDAIPMPIFVKDPAAIYSTCNEAYEVAFGDKREDIVGKTLLEMDILTKEERVHIHEDDLNLIQSGDFRREEATREYADGKTYDVMYWRRTFNRADGSPGGMVGLLIDISDRKKSEETIRRRAMEASLLHRATQLAAESDAFDESLQQCIDLVCELTGWPIGHVYLPVENDTSLLVSASIWRISDPEKYAEFKSVSEKSVFQMGEGLPGRIWQTSAPAWIPDVTSDSNIPRKDICKQLNIHGAFGFPIEVRDEVVAVLEFFSEKVVAVDKRLMETMATVGIQVGQVLERKRTADELSEAKDAADEANRTKSAFLANMSHELRTPMNAILGYAEMLAEDAEEEGNDDQLSDLKEIMDAGEHLLNLVNDVLDISKIEAGRMDLFLETFDLTKMMNEVASTTKALVDKNKNKMVVSIADEIGEMHADVTKIRQILFNLMSNAAKFASKGTITLFGERRIEASGDIIRLGVADDGIGIPQDKLERIFEEFSQADDSTTKNFGGTGLGLALVKRFCQMMGGDVWVESTEGEGSSFILELPAVVIDVEKAETAETGQEISESESGKLDIPAGEGSILVIDNDRSARDLIRRSLESEGHHVTVAEDGNKGIALAHKIRPALITLEIIMPGRDGWSVLQELKDDPGLRDIPVIMVSIIDDKKMGSALGAVDHLSKPVDRARLITLVKRYTKKGRALVVEDDAAVRKVVTRALSSIGWTSVEAVDGAGGIEKFGGGKFDLIILDIMMPVMDGFGFIRELRLTEKGRSVPVVVLTAKDLTKQEHKELNGNVEEIFLKEEASIDELVKEIGNQLASKL